MKVLVLKCSPRPQSYSDQLAEAFVQGAKEAGHEVQEFKVGNAKISPCIGCAQCGQNGKHCVFDDMMTEIYPAFLAADVIVLSTPIYYFNITAQGKAVLDRLHSLHEQEILKAGALKGKKMALLASATLEGEPIFAFAERDIRFVWCDYYGADFVGGVYMGGVNKPGTDVSGRDEMKEARRLGGSI